MGLNYFESRANRITGLRAYKTQGEPCSPAHVEIYRRSQDMDLSEKYRKDMKYLLKGLTGEVKYSRVTKLADFVGQLTGLFTPRIFYSVAQAFQRMKDKSHDVRREIPSSSKTRKV